MPNSVQAVFTGTPFMIKSQPSTSTTPYNLFSYFLHTNPYIYRFILDGSKHIRIKRVKVMATQVLVNHRPKKIFNPYREVTLVEEHKEKTVYMVIFHLQNDGGRKTVGIGLHIHRIQPQSSVKTGCIKNISLLIKCFTGKMDLPSSSLFSLSLANCLPESIAVWVMESEAISIGNTYAVQPGVKWIRVKISPGGTCTALGKELVSALVTLSDKGRDKGPLRRRVETFGRKNMRQKLRDHVDYFYPVKRLFAAKIISIKAHCPGPYKAIPTTKGMENEERANSFLGGPEIHVFSEEMREFGKTQLSQAQ